MREYQRNEEEFGISQDEFAGNSYDNLLNNNNIINNNNNNENEGSEIERTKTNVTRVSTRNSLQPSDYRKSYQIRAMLRKTLSYQKRQIGTNLFCVIACPTLLIVIAFLLSMLLEHFLSNIMEKSEYEYCSNEFNGTYVFPLSPESYKKNEKNVRLAHYDSKLNTCSIWFGTNDHFHSSPYDIVPDDNVKNINRDTIFVPPVNASGNYAYLFNKLGEVTGLGDMNSMIEKLEAMDQMGNLTPEQIQQMMAGGGNFGNLTPEQIQQIMNGGALGNLTPEQIQQLMGGGAGLGNFGNLTPEQMQELMNGNGSFGGLGGLGGANGFDTSNLTPEQLQELMNKYGNGANGIGGIGGIGGNDNLTPEQIQELLKNYGGANLTPEQIQELLKNNGDGNNLSLEQIQELLKKYGIGNNADNGNTGNNNGNNNDNGSTTKPPTQQNPENPNTGNNNSNGNGNGNGNGNSNGNGSGNGNSSGNGNGNGNGNSIGGLTPEQIQEYFKKNGGGTGSNLTPEQIQDYLSKRGNGSNNVSQKQIEEYLKNLNNRSNSKRYLHKRATSTKSSNTTTKKTSTSTSTSTSTTSTTTSTSTSTTSTTTSTSTATETGDTKNTVFTDPAIFYIARNMMRPWGIIAFNNNNATEKAIIGHRHEGPKNITLLEIDKDQYETEDKGILDYTYSRYFLNMYGLMYSEVPSIQFERLPYFEEIKIENEDELDEDLTRRIKLVNKILKNTTFSDYTDEDKKLIDLSELKGTEDAIKKSVDYMPYGAMLINSIEEDKLKYDILIAVGQNQKLDRIYSYGTNGYDVIPYMSYPGKGKRLLYFLTEFDSSWLRRLTNNSSSISQGFRSFPERIINNEIGIDINVPSIIGAILYPWGVSFLIPIFVMSLVKEKEERYLVMMNMNGMKSSTYYIFTYLTDLILSILSMTCFIIAGKLCNMAMFTKTSLIVLAFEFFIWANVQVILSFVLSFFFKRNSTALMTSFLIVLVSVVFGFTLSSKTMEDTNIYFIWAPLAFYYILYKFSSIAVVNELPPYQLHNFIPGDRVFTATMFFIVDFFVLLALAFYFNAILPQEYGSHKPWHLNIFKRFKKNKKYRDDYSLDDGSIDEQSMISHHQEGPFYNEKEEEEAKILEDDDVRAERNRVLSGNYDHNSPLIIKNIRKEYEPRVKGENPHVAVRSATFAVEEGIVFGLLGPNGAGKTTLIHSLIGVYPPTSGYAKLAGFNIDTDMNQVYKRIGICPQHDILWNDLTVEEHILFYARLKGIPRKGEEEAIHDSLNSVGLLDFRKNLVKGLSGGEKRRLSIAIALVGNPKLVFLDEPTTGLDPDVRRLIWSILEEISQGRTIIITTHSMEEAEVLCHRIAIMSHGTIRCCNTQLRLKELYGTGFRLTYSNDPQKYKELKEYVNSILPINKKFIRDLASNSIYEFIPTQGLISHLFEIIEENKDKYGIIDWGISQSSLEEVFLSIISEDDADAN
ncbi:hypothetical protein BCR32DRAFT_232892 [Anaeromyces robustus]|uniref:ABC transporter domain-containing protein n=1 Tax=Anaeromyces robustus TaxID=1754192 RepID=A0A1Y1X693_9FUNG|nr:hypothetical protein BCR32DRAFT_232892 [Anaeromyces robustus]|eukprot:ORX81188.1 hypothetical protein BCR32DRAFT_232892 [Anaeromyces robustus]